MRTGELAVFRRDATLPIRIFLLREGANLWGFKTRADLGNLGHLEHLGTLHQNFTVLFFLLLTFLRNFSYQLSFYKYCRSESKIVTRYEYLKVTPYAKN